MSFNQVTGRIKVDVYDPKMDCLDRKSDKSKNTT